MKLSVAGINHKSAPVEVRERFSLMDDEALQFLQSSVDGGILREALILNTCNRTEIYYVPEEHTLSAGELFGRAVGAGEVDQQPFYQYERLQAVSHLFKVAASLDSQVVGEDEIQGQIKDAYRLAHEAGTTGATINKLFHRAFRVGKRVRSETMLNEGCASISRAAVDLSQQVLGTLEGKRILLLGAGETAQKAVFSLLGMRPGLLALANRSPGRARDLLISLARSSLSPETRARVCPAVRDILGDMGILDEKGDELAMPETRILELEEVPEVIGKFDLVICSTASPRPVLRREHCVRELEALEHTLLIIDIAVPRDVDPALGEMPGVVLRNIDDLNREVEENLDRRRGEIPRAEAIVEEEVEKFSDWMDARRVVPTIKLLRAHVNEIKEAEIERYGKNFDPADRDDLEKFARSLCRKILHDPVSFLREEATSTENGEHAEAAALIRRIFDLAKKGRASQEQELVLGGCAAGRWEPAGFWVFTSFAAPATHQLLPAMNVTGSRSELASAFHFSFIPHRGPVVRGCVIQGGYRTDLSGLCG